MKHVMCFFVVSAFCLVGLQAWADDAAPAAADAPAAAAEAAPAPTADAPAPTKEQIDAAIAKGVEYLRGIQLEDGSFSRMMGPGMTGIVLIGLLENGISVDDPMVAKALKYMEAQAKADGSISGSGMGSYETSVAIVALVMANKDGRYNDLLKRAEKYLRKYQWDESEGRDPSDPKYGGAGYGSRMSRPDLSNTGFMLDALKALGAGKDDEAVKKALVFVSRSQNLESQYNTMPYAAAGDKDGGFIYNFQQNDKMPAGKANEPLKSYGSMTYTGFKSLIYAGLTPDDPRMKAATEWLQKNYSVTENPGQGLGGLYYYYCVMSKALALYGDTFTDAEGKVHNWRNEIMAELIKNQQPDGSWVNSNNRWQENNAMLVTGYALIIFGNCRK